MSEKDYLITAYSVNDDYTKGKAFAINPEHIILDNVVYQRWDVYQILDYFESSQTLLVSNVAKNKYGRYACYLQYKFGGMYVINTRIATIESYDVSIAFQYAKLVNSDIKDALVFDK